MHSPTPEEIRAERSRALVNRNGEFAVSRQKQYRLDNEAVAARMRAAGKPVAEELTPRQQALLELSRPHKPL